MCLGLRWIRACELTSARLASILFVSRSIGRPPRYVPAYEHWPGADPAADPAANPATNHQAADPAADPAAHPTSDELSDHHMRIHRHWLNNGRQQHVRATRSKAAAACLSRNFDLDICKHVCQTAHALLGVGAPTLPRPPSVLGSFGNPAPDVAFALLVPSQTHVSLNSCGSGFDT